MIGVRQRFTPLQRLLHWLMAVCILVMLFIGVGMVSTVTPKFLSLVAIHKSLGVAILVLALIRLAVRLRYGAPALPADLPKPMKLAAHLLHYAIPGAVAADRLPADCCRSSAMAVAEPLQPSHGLAHQEHPAVGKVIMCQVFI